MALLTAPRRASRDALVTLSFGVLSFAVAFAQRPGWSTSDTKIDLHIDPVTFLGQASSLWSPRIGFGAVQSAQYSGYLWPMGSLFAALHELGVSPWVAERVWLGLIYALAAWGMLRLMDVLAGERRGVAHVVAALLFMLNPYTVTFTGRTSVTLLGYAALPWLLIVVHRGVRNVGGPLRGIRGWAWAGAFALIVTSLGGGINAAVVAWMLVGPLVLLVYEPLIGEVRWRDAGLFVVRSALLGVVASLWWIVPLLLYSRYGVDFLQYTEQPFTIWATNSSTEVLRLMGYWTSYIGVGFYGLYAPYSSEAGVLLFNPLVVGASLLVPALAVASIAWCRRWRYAPFLLLLVLVAAVIEIAAFPAGTPARGALQWLYDHLPALRFLRTTQKAAPLMAVGLAGLLGAGAQLAWQRLLGYGPRRRGRLLAGVAGAALLAVIAVAALPLVRGTAVEKQLMWKRIPSAWTIAGRQLDRTLTPGTRALVLPGQVFAFYRWGGTIDPILPRLTQRPVAVRSETPYEDPHAADLLITIDSLVQQARLFPGQLRPLLRLAGVGAVISAADDDIRRSGAVDPVSAAATLAGQGLAQPDASYGPVRTLTPAPGQLEASRGLPEVRRYDIAASLGIVHVAPLGPPTIVDGNAEGLAAMAAFGALQLDRPLFYASDLSMTALRRAASTGANVVITDSNRRRAFLPQFVTQDVGVTLTARQRLGENMASLNPFAVRGPAAQTIAVLEGARYLRTPSQAGYAAFPEHAPIAAFDGDPSTSWVADRYLPPYDRWIEIGFEHPLDVPYVDLEPIRDPFGIEEDVVVNGVHAHLGPGVTRVWLHQRHISSLRVTLTHVRQPPGNTRGSGGFREIRIPGVHVRELLRPPVVAAEALAGRSLARVGLTWILERTIADRPFQLDRRTGSQLLELPENRQDPEQTLDRQVLSPATRSYAVDALVYPSLTVADDALDRLAGVSPGVRLDSSDRFNNQARYRASSAFDGQRGSAWVARWAPIAAPPPWISWSTRRSATLSSLRLEPAPLPVRRPTVVRVSWPGGSTPALSVAADGTVRMPRPITARAFRLTILSAAFAHGSTSSVPAVGIGEIVGGGVPVVRVPRRGPLHPGCGDASVVVGGRLVGLVPRGDVATLDAGEPLRAQACGGPVRMGAGLQEIRSVAAPFSVDLLRLRSPAALPAPTGGGEVLSPGTVSNDAVNSVRLRLLGRSWLVLGESFSRGWEARCNGRSLGTPRPIDGYANGWLAPADCREASFVFGPQRTAQTAYVLSAVFCGLLCILLVALRAPRRLPRARRPELADDRLPQLSLVRAVIVAALATVPLCLLFALRTSLGIFPVLAFSLWRGVPARRLAIVAAGLLGIAVPAAYAIASPQNRGGYNFDYSIRTIGAHWIGVLALVLLMVACGRMLIAARRGRPPVEPPPPELPERRLEALAGRR